MDGNQQAGMLKMAIGQRTLPSVPVAGDIMKSLIMLDDSPDGYVVLSRGSDWFMQCHGTAAQGFFIECRNGSDDQHYLSADDKLQLETASQLLVSYLTDDHRWRDMILWHPYDEERAIPVRPTEQKKGWGPIEKHGNTIVVNKRWCLVAAGLLLYALGVMVFFVLTSITITGGANIAGPLLALGTVLLIMSCFTGD